LLINGVVKVLATDLINFIKFCKYRIIFFLKKKRRKKTPTTFLGVPKPKETQGLGSTFATIIL